MATLLTAEEGKVPAENEVYVLQKDGSVAKQAESANPYECVGKQTNDKLEIAGQVVGTWGEKSTVTYKVTSKADDKAIVKIEPVAPATGG